MNPAQASHEIEKHVLAILQLIGEDPERSGLRDTPRRVARMYREIFRGYEEFPAEQIKTFPSPDYNGLVVRTGIPFFSMCEHHMLPYMGTVDLGYVVEKTVLGISKMIRLVQHMSARLTIQEGLTHQIAQEFNNHGIVDVMVVIRSTVHLCEAMRGVKTTGVPLVTSVITGKFWTNDALRNECLSLMKR